MEKRRAPVVELVALAEVEVVDGAVEVALLERHLREAPARVAAAEHLVAAAGPVEVARGGHVEDLAAERHVDRRGVVAAVEMTRAGYPNRSSHAAFLARYGRLTSSGDVTSVARSLLGERRHAVGKTRVYLGPGVLEFLERLDRKHEEEAAATALIGAIGEMDAEVAEAHEALQDAHERSEVRQRGRNRVPKKVEWSL